MSQGESIGSRMTTKGRRDGRVLNLFRTLTVLLFMLSTIRLSWMSDDALITLRTALNMTHGWGPGFNATEHVQAYTHPLWYLLWSGIGALTNQWILGLFALSAILVAVAVGILVWQVRSLARLVLVSTVLFLSNAFMDFTTSGLENPLSYALIAVLMALTLTTKAYAGHARWMLPALVGLSSAAILLTRLDLAALVAVPVAWWLWRVRRSAIGLVAFAAAAALPLILWFAWSYSTYASFLPNTFLAKRNTEIAQAEFVVQGIRYLWVSFNYDLISLLAIVLGVGLGLVCGRSGHRAWAAGVLMYAGYVVWIGGDFMGGRFLAVLVYVGVFLIGVVPLPQLHSMGIRPGNTLVLSMVGVVLILALSSASGTQVTSLSNPQAPRWEVDQNFNSGIDDARGSSVADADSLKYYLDNLSLEYTNPDFAGIGDGSGLGRTLRELDRSASLWPVSNGTPENPIEVGEFCGYLGNVGIATGPTRHLVDDCALTDRYLAEKKSYADRPFAWKPGHFHRVVPEGYLEAVLTGDPTKVKDPAEAFILQKLWQQIRD